ncbi:MAG: NAD(P)H-binding protein [Bacteroidota bacterium]
MKRILITTGNGMFGSALINVLKNKEVLMRIMVRDRNRFTFSGPRAEIVTGDMDKPETMETLMEGVDSIFLTAPIDERLAVRETAVIRRARQSGVGQIVKIAGAVRLEMEVLCHLRAWREGGADLVTSAFESLTSRKPTPVDEFIHNNLEHFSKGMVPAFMASLLRLAV